MWEVNSKKIDIQSVHIEWILKKTNFVYERETQVSSAIFRGYKVVLVCY